MKELFYILIFSLSLVACGGGENTSNEQTEVLIETNTFTFTSSISSETLTQIDDVVFFLSYENNKEKVFKIETDDDLLRINKTLHDTEKLNINDLVIWTYFFISAPYGCNDYYKYSKHDYSNGLLMVTVDWFNNGLEIACLPVVAENYMVFKAKKP